MEKKDEPEKNNEFDRPEKDMQPKRRTEVRYKLFDSNTIYQGKVKDVGKANSSNRLSCWIEDENKVVNVVDFATEVENWKYIKKVTFDNIEQNKGERNLNLAYLADINKDRKSQRITNSQ